MKFSLAFVASALATVTAFVPPTAFNRVRVSCPKTVVFMGDEVMGTIQQIVADQLGVDTGAVTEDSTFEELGADSLDQVELIMALEEAFEIDIDDDAASSMTNLKDVIDYIGKSKST
mmetsp:Transcript_19705/g.29917  ORF Transcript_19705/g.29917 Transcript_19705/m.29917 type:complete len:117 (+) Transcript_19705:84-434(+)|eukprot:CAMPEP_0118710598 /NCGR_PEP_ID=MMETSP0800-20121206/23494_1 /TAXON_ID=210618 ORGANISM="Striatella unipunctata, Strain CCMP2910" /NCGR_SAMPLE_ID=MMETSP0800 /ASSEMBLY_ACC=CAM_ASM_000638 /LENGTH=116 /DNA_ID=CAMNT_0006614845 /DNA_START=79 /DNA_END=429 /DNA_ORIENTATION=-